MAIQLTSLDAYRSSKWIHVPSYATASSTIFNYYLPKLHRVIFMEDADIVNNKYNSVIQCLHFVRHYVFNTE